MIDRKKDVFGVVRHDTSLKYLPGNYTDFEEDWLEKRSSTHGGAPKMHIARNLQVTRGVRKSSERQ